MFAIFKTAKFWAGLGVAVAAAFLLYQLYSFGFNSGEASKQAEWNEAKIERQEEVDRLEERNATLVRNHRATVRELTDRLGIAEQVHAADLAALRASYDQRLRDSQDRAGLYQRLSDGGAAERERLARYAAELDGALVEGRQLVGEYRSALELSERQRLALGDQIRADRAVINAEGIDPQTDLEVNP